MPEYLTPTLAVASFLQASDAATARSAIGAAEDGGGASLPSWFDGSGDGYNGATAFSLDATGCGDNTVSVGYHANGTSYGVAVGNASNGGYYGAAVGYYSSASNYGAAVGYGADGSNFGTSVGRGSNGSYSGAAVGYSSSSSSNGVAVGAYSDGSGYGVAVGRDSHGTEYGVAVGYGAVGNCNGNVALGAGAIANPDGCHTHTTMIGCGCATVAGALHYRGYPIASGRGRIIAGAASPSLTSPTNGEVIVDACAGKIYAATADAPSGWLVADLAFTNYTP